MCRAGTIAFILELLEFFLNVFTEFAEFSDKKIVITAKGFELKPSLAFESSMLPKRQTDTCNRQVYIESNSCFSDLTVSLNSLKSRSI